MIEFSRKIYTGELAMSSQASNDKNSPKADLSLQELLGIAIKSEIEAAEIYRNLLNRDLPEETRKRLESLVEQE